MRPGSRLTPLLPTQHGLHLHPKESTQGWPRGRKRQAITTFVFPFSGREEKPGLTFMLSISICRKSTNLKHALWSQTSLETQAPRLHGRNALLWILLTGADRDGSWSTREDGLG